MAQAIFTDSVNDREVIKLGANLLFEEHFTDYAINVFPSKWEDSHYFKTQSVFDGKAQCCGVQVSGERKFLSIPYETGLIPKMETFALLGNSFTVEYDVFSNPDSHFELSFYDVTTERDGRYDYFIIGVNNDGLVEYNSWKAGVYTEHHAQYHGVFDFKRWHHVDFSYNNGVLKYFLDSTLTFVLNDCKCITPKNGSFLFYNKGEVAYANIKIATNDAYDKFNKILTGTKFVTHDINFASKSAVMDTKSSQYVAELAAWLVQNQKVRLQIDGHTDNNGTDAANEKLSLARANAVKAKLVAGGVDSSRLVTHGFGSEIPLEPNNTEQGRATNRRVELKKL